MNDSAASVPPSGELASLRSFADALAREAGAITLRHFGGVVEADRKGDGTPVTRADREAEEFLREAIHRRFPHHGILGEEFGETNSGAAVRWLLDPIDGTKAFMQGVPLFAVLIGVEVEGIPSVGVAHFPALGEHVSAARGLGCSWNGRPCRVSAVKEVRSAVVLTTDPAVLLDGPLARGWAELSREADTARTWGDAYGHVLVATGRAEVMIDPVLNPWDAAPFVPILREAGGIFTDLAGREDIHGGSGVATNGHLHETVLRRLAAGGTCCG